MDEKQSHPFDREPSIVTHADVEGPPLTEGMVVRAEAELGRSLPASYVSLMRRCNGGYLRNTAIPTSRATSWAEDHVSVRSIFGIPAEDDEGRFGTGSGILCTASMTSEWGLPQDVVLLDGDGHTWIALDYRTDPHAVEPAVLWLDVELDDELTIASSFDELIEKLRPESEFDAEL